MVSEGICHYHPILSAIIQAGTFTELGQARCLTIILVGRDHSQSMWTIVSTLMNLSIVQYSSSCTTCDGIPYSLTHQSPQCIAVIFELFTDCHYLICICIVLCVAACP